MSANIVWSLTNGGSAITDPVDHGSSSSGAALTAQEIFIRHDGVNPITDCGFYLAQKSGVYSGNQLASTDLSEILSWGNGVSSTTFGGFQLNMDAENAYAGNWPTYSSKYGTSYNVFRTNTGDSLANKIILASAMGLTSGAGIIQAGTSPNVRFQCRIQIPTNETINGIRQFDQKLRFTYTT